MKTPNENSPDIPTSIVMKGTRRWVMRDENNVIYLLNGQRYRSDRDFKADNQLFGTYDEAWNQVRGQLVGVAFTLGPDGTGRHWQEIIIADVQWNFSNATAWLPAGYVEICSDGKGIHGIGYGRRFDTLVRNASGIEAYAEDRFFIFRGTSLRDEALTCLAGFVERDVRAYHAGLDGHAGATPKPNSAKPLSFR